MRKLEDMYDVAHALALTEPCQREPSAIIQPTKQSTQLD